MAPANQRERLDMLLDLNPRYGPRNVTAVFKVLEILVGVTPPHLPSVKDCPRAEVKVTPFFRRWKMWRTKAD